MALIRCSECNKEISDKAEKCTNCGCPITEIIKEGIVTIKLPNTDIIASSWTGLFSSKKADITDDESYILWEGKHGETAKFKLDKPTKITISLGIWANTVKGIVKPGKKYSLVQDYGIHLFTTFRLTEIDIIDSE